MSRDRWTEICSALHFSRNVSSDTEGESDDDTVIDYEEDGGETFSRVPLLHGLNDPVVKWASLIGSRIY